MFIEFDSLLNHLENSMSKRKGKVEKNKTSHLYGVEKTKYEQQH